MTIKELIEKLSSIDPETKIKSCTIRYEDDENDE